MRTRNKMGCSLIGAILLWLGAHLLAGAIQAQDTCSVGISWAEPFTRDGHAAPLRWSTVVRYVCGTEPPEYVPGVLSNARVTWELDSIETEEETGQ